jgi:hypothetical protein
VRATLSIYSALLKSDLDEVFAADTLRNVWRWQRKTRKIGPHECSIGEAERA